MSLSYDEIPNSHLVALREYKHKKRNKSVFFSEDVGEKVITPEDISDDLLEEYYGKRAIKYEKNKKALREEMCKLVNGNKKLVRKTNELRIDDKSQFEIVPFFDDETKRQIHYLSGQAGAGKSYIAKSLLKYYHMFIPKKRVLVITPVQETNPTYLKYGNFIDIDKLVAVDRNDSYDDLMRKYKEEKIFFRQEKKSLEPHELIKREIEIERMKPTSKDKTKASFTTTPLYEEWAKQGPSVVVFDDYEALNGDKKQRALFLIKRIGEVGRHSSTNMIVISHLTNDYANTRSIVMESHNIILFKRNLWKFSKYLMKAYLGFDASLINRVYKLFGEGNRWLCINKTYNFITCPKQMFVY